MRIRLALLCLLLAACTDFDAVGRGICGNGLLEAGEDCDSSDPSCVRCAVACTTSDDCPAEGFACGVDNLCHAPIGGFASAVENDPLPVQDVAITDIDRDGIGDVLGVSATAISVRYGAQSALLSRADSLSTPQQRARPSLGDVDLDGSIDVAISALDGLVTYTSRFGELSAAAAATTNAEDARLLDVYLSQSITAYTSVAIVGDDDGQAVLAAVNNDSVLDPVLLYPCEARLGRFAAKDLQPDNIDLYLVTPDPFVGGTTTPIEEGEVVVALTAAGRSCVLSIRTHAATRADVVDITPPGLEEGARVLLARTDLDPNPCPDLVDSVGGSESIRIFPGVSSGDQCALGTARPMEFITDFGAPAPDVAFVGTIDIVEAVEQLPIAERALAPDVLAGTDGLYALVDLAAPSIFAVKVYGSSARIARSASGDFNGDGIGDGVLVREDVEDLEVIYVTTREDAGIAIQPWRIDTETPIGALLVADFDGNRVDDISFVGSGSVERVQVSYGTADRPLAPVTVFVTDKVRALERVAIADSVDPASLSADLIAINGAFGQPISRTALFHGSSQRTLISYFNPAFALDGADNADFKVDASIIGRFAPGDRSGVLAVNNDNVSRFTRQYGFFLPASASGLEVEQFPFAELDSTLIGALEGCEPSSALCPNEALYLAWPTASGIEVPIGIDRDRRAVVLAPTGERSRAANPVAAIIEALAGEGGAPVPGSLHRATLDGGAPRLVASFSRESAQGQVLVCSVDDSGAPSECEDVVPAITDLATGFVCRDAAPVRLSAGAATQSIAVACSDSTTTQIYRVDLVDGELTAGRLADVRVPLRALRAGDVTGDGVEDLVGISVSGSLYVAPQCTSRDPATCSATVEEGP